jgi:hypothetical protein
MKALPQLFVRKYDDINDPYAWVLLDLYDTDPLRADTKMIKSLSFVFLLITKKSSVSSN